MNLADVLAALALPPEARVERRVPKRMLVEKGAPAAGDKRQINEGIEEFLWLAALKPSTIGVPEFRDERREYLEIAVLSLALRPTARRARLAELVHRAIPYPVVLLARQADGVTLSLVHKRRSQGEADRVVLDDAPVEAELSEHAPGSEMLASLAVARQPRDNLLTLYQGWIDCLRAIQAAAITGRFELRADAASAALRSEALIEFDRLTRQIAELSRRAERDAQIPRRVELNLEIANLRVALDAARHNL